MWSVRRDGKWKIDFSTQKLIVNAFVVSILVESLTITEIRTCVLQLTMIKDTTPSCVIVVCEK
jgi:hypothetical protein